MSEQPVSNQPVLLPCPFCGGIAIQSWDDHEQPADYYVHCDVCDSDGEWCRTADGAIAAWNKRASDNELRDLRTALPLLVAEREELQKRVAEMEGDWKAICDAAEAMPAGTVEFDLRRRIAELERSLCDAGYICTCVNGDEPCVMHQRAADTPKAECDVAPIAKLTVNEDDTATAEMYAPGLPPGTHDLYPAPSQPPPASQWKPIETAPDNGTILICGGTFTHDSGDYADWPLDFVTIAHRKNRDSIWEDEPYQYEPEFWMPLPQSPSQTAAVPRNPCICKSTLCLVANPDCPIHGDGLSSTKAGNQP